MEERSDKPLPVDAGGFVLFRMDDNGQSVRVGLFETGEQADKAMRDFESRGHKQTYWVEAPG